ncbi:MAG: outer membrane beta-barrel protein [Flavipsychrobacter sp.]
MMSMKTFWLFLLTFCVTYNSVFAHNITGVVTDDDGKEIVAASVLLITDKKELVSSTLSDETGAFNLNNVQEGSYQLKVTMIGYNEYSKAIVVSKSVDVGALVMKRKNKAMKEVTVRGTKPLIEVFADKLVVNVENSIVNSGATALEVLSRSPYVNVDNNDNISVKGKQGVTVMVDGKQMVLSGTDLANMLKSMPSNTISKIEIISNPGAKYDAAGTAGIINIKTKRDKRLGMNGSANASYAQGVYPKASIGFNLNYRTKKISSYVSYNYASRAFFNHLVLDRRFYDNNDVAQFSYMQDNFTKGTSLNHVGSMGIDYTLSKKTTVGISGTVGTNGFSPKANNHSSALDGNKNTLYRFITTGNHRQDYYNYSANANLRHNFDDKGQQLSVDVDYARYWNESNQNFETVYLSPNGASYQPNYYMRSDLVGLTQIRSFKTDYSLPLKNKAAFEAGIKTSYVTSNNRPLFYEKTTGDFLLDVKRSNHFIYRENINAGYLNLNKKWDKWSTQIGLRVEHTNIEAEQVTLDSTFKRNYTQLFPSVAVQRTISKKHDLGVTLSRRIQRPNYQQLNPFKFFIDNTTYREGYPYLNPALTYSVEASHIFKKKFVTSIGYSVTTNNITQVIQPSETEDSVTVQTDKNLATMHYYGLTGAYPFQITKWWSNVSNISLYYLHYQGFLANTNLSNGTPAFTVSSNNNFTLPMGFRAELGFWYQAKQVYGFMELEPMWMLNAGLQKQVFKNKGTIRLNVNDLFWKGLPRATSTYNAYQEDFVVKRESRQVSITFSYRFGKQTVPQTRKRKGGATDEMKRVGNAG